MKLKHFRLSEFDSPDLPGSGSKMDPSFLEKLVFARVVANTPFVINSGYRTAEHNAKVRGSETSSHLHGYAADIRAETPAIAARIISALYYAGIRRIGYYPTKGFIHADVDPGKPSPAFWDDT